MNSKKNLFQFLFDLECKCFLIPIITLLLISFSNTGVVLANTSDSQIRIFRHYTSNNGLSNNIITNILQDSIGFLWFGTEDGLNRFDGYSFRNYKTIPDDENSLPSNIINNIVCDFEGKLWIATPNGICSYNEETNDFKRYRLTPEERTNNIEFIKIDDEGNIVILNYEGDIWIYNKSLDNFELLLPNQSGDLFKTFYIDNKIYYLGGNTSLYVFNNFKFIDSIPLFKNEYGESFGISGIQEFNGDIWVSSIGGGITILNKKLEVTNRIVSDIQAKNYIQSLHVPSSGNEILASSGDGLISYSNDGSINYQLNDNYIDPKYGVANKQIRSAFLDKQNNLWVGTIQGISQLINNKPFELIHTYHWSNDEQVRSMLIDDPKNLWIGTNEMIYVYDSTHKLINSFSGDDVNPKLEELGTVFEIFQDSAKNIWVAAYHSGLLKYNSKSNKLDQIFKKSDFGGLDIRSIKVDNLGNFWMANHGFGLARYNPEENSFRQFKFNPESEIPTLIDNWIFVLELTNKGKLWCGTPAGILFCALQHPI